MPDDPMLMLFVALAFLLAGWVKGVIGFGLPIVAIALLTATVGLKPAIVLMLAPSLVTNVWQALAGGRLLAISRRLFSLMCCSVAGIWLGVGWLAVGDVRVSSALLGAVLAAYAAFGLMNLRLPFPGGAEWIWSPVVGAINGVLAGLTGSFTLPAIPYFQALGFNRDELIQAMGLLFLVSTVALAVALGDKRLLTVELGFYSLAGVPPALAGMWIGQRVRHGLSEITFRRTFLISVLAMGIYISAKAFF